MKKLLIVMCMVVTTIGVAQKITVVQGNLSRMKGEKSVNVKFTYDDMIVGAEKPEAEYVSERTATMNANAPGSGDKWAAAWVDDRTSRFQPQFRTLFSKYAGMSTVNEKATYTLIFKTKRTEPGWKVMPLIRKSAFIDADIMVVETANPTKILATIRMIGAPGRAGGLDFEAGFRIQEAYAMAGRQLGKLFANAAK